MAPTRRERYAFWKYWDEQVDWSYLESALREKRSTEDGVTVAPYALSMEHTGSKIDLLGLIHYPVDGEVRDFLLSSLTNLMGQYDVVLAEDGLFKYDFLTVLNHLVDGLGDTDATRLSESPGVPRPLAGLMSQYLKSCDRTLGARLHHQMAQRDLRRRTRSREGATYKARFRRYIEDRFYEDMSTPKGYRAALRWARSINLLWPLDWPETGFNHVTRRRSWYMASTARKRATQTGATNLLLLVGIAHEMQVAEWLVHPQSEDLAVAYAQYRLHLPDYHAADVKPPLREAWPKKHPRK